MTTEQLFQNPGIVNNQVDNKNAPALTETEELELNTLEARVEQAFKAFWEIGSVLEEIRDKRLYRSNYKTFSEYCQSRWRLARRTAYQFIEAAKVFENVRHGAQKILPTNERQVRPLTPLSPEKQQQVWDTVVETAPFGKITAAHVVRCVKEITTEKDQKPIERSCWNCRYSNSELIKDDSHFFHCDKFGKLNFVEKDGIQIASECDSWTYRFSAIETLKKEKDTFTLKIPKELQPLIKEAALSEDLAVADWVSKVLKAALNTLIVN